MRPTANAAGDVSGGGRSRSRDRRFNEADGQRRRRWPPEVGSRRRGTCFNEADGQRRRRSDSPAGAAPAGRGFNEADGQRRRRSTRLLLGRGARDGASMRPTANAAGDSRGECRDDHARVASMRPTANAAGDRGAR